jgi:hypothetical protein
VEVPPTLHNTPPVIEAPSKVAPPVVPPVEVPPRLHNTPPVIEAPSKVAPPTEIPPPPEKAVPPEAKVETAPPKTVGPPPPAPPGAAGVAPAGRAGTPVAPLAPPELIIGLALDGSATLDGNPIEATELAARLKTAGEQAPKPKVVIEIQQGLPYEQIQKVLEMCAKSFLRTRVRQHRAPGTPTPKK